MLELNFKNRNLSTEWLVTNGIGGYASSTIAGTNTRRYHGLLVAALNPPVERKVMVSKVEETIVTEDGNFELGSNFYPGVIYPEGYITIESFERNPLPKTHSKSIFTRKIVSTVFLKYSMEKIHLREKVQLIRHGRLVQ